MNFKTYSRILSLALAVLIMVPVYPQNVSNKKNSAKRIFAQAATVSKEKINLAADASKRSLKETAEKFSLKNRDLIQGAVIGSTLLGASFLVNDPRLQWILRAAAVLPMLVGVFAPKKLIQKASKLEIDEVSCANLACKGVCAECRITKSYLATIPLALVSYGIAWMFTKRSVTVPGVPPINPDEAPSTSDFAKASPFAGPMADKSPDKPISEDINNDVKNNTPEPVPAPQNNVENPAQNDTQESLLYVRAREGENAEAQARPAQDAAPEIIPPKGKEEADANDDASAPQPSQENQGWLDWTKEKLADAVFGKPTDAEIIAEHEAEVAAAHEAWKFAPEGTPLPEIVSQEIQTASLAKEMNENVSESESEPVDAEDVPVAAEQDAPEAYEDESSSEEEQGEEQESGWGSWLASWIAPEVDYDNFDTHN